MTVFVALAGAMGLLTAAIASMAVWWAPGWRRRAVVLALVTAILALHHLALAELLSRPKPVRLAWFENRADEAEVLRGVIREGQAIYLWLRLPGVDEPRSYALPWDRGLAEQLQKALMEAEENGTGVKMRLPFEPSWDNREPKFYALPQPALPPKDALDPPRWVEHPGQEA